MFAVMGLVAGILLTVVSKLFEVKTDPRTEEVNEALPQINCGACGYSGCSDYAKAIVEKGAPTNLCRPGGAKVAAKVNDIMGGDASMEISKEIAVVRCSGDCDTEKHTFDFDGVQTCANAKRFYGGMWGCKYGCIGCKICERQCEFDAIHVTDNLARIDYSKCTACGKCAAKCPVHVIHMDK